jgi:serine/threonine-protein kinase
MVTESEQDRAAAGATEPQAGQDGPPAARYRILREVGRGEMSVVYEAFDPLLERSVALKLLSLAPSLTTEQREARLSRFKREAEAVARLRHPNVVHVFDFGRDPDGTPYLVMEFVDGLTLAALLAERGPVPPARAAALLSQIADGLDAVHAQGVVHRDLKPGNIMLRGGAVATAPDDAPPERGAVKLLDFGLARHDDDVTLTRTGVLVGSPAYLSPERVRGEPATTAADLWALSVVLYEMLAGRRPFGGEDTISALYQIAHTEAPRLRGLGAGVEEVLARALDRDPRRRYPTARALADAFHAAVDLAPADLRPPLIPPPGPDAAKTLEVDRRAFFAAADSSPSLPTPVAVAPFDVPLPAARRKPAARPSALVVVPVLLTLGGVGVATLAARDRTGAPVAPAPAATPQPRRVVQAVPEPSPSLKAARPVPARPKPTPAAVTPVAGATPAPAPSPTPLVVYVPVPATPTPRPSVALRPAPKPSPVQVASAKPVAVAPPPAAIPKPRPTPASTPPPSAEEEESEPKPSAAPPKPKPASPAVHRIRRVAQAARRPGRGAEVPVPAPEEDAPRPEPSRDAGRDRDHGADDEASRVPAGDALLGVWRGNVWKNRGTLNITSRDGDNFSGVLTLRTDRGVARLSITGYVAPATGRIAFWSTGTLSGSDVADIDIGQEQGRFISQRLMGGLGMDAKQAVFTWSMSR